MPPPPPLRCALLFLRAFCPPGFCLPIGHALPSAHDECDDDDDDATSLVSGGDLKRRRKNGSVHAQVARPCTVTTFRRRLRESRGTLRPSRADPIRHSGRQTCGCGESLRSLPARARSVGCTQNLSGACKERGGMNERTNEQRDARSSPCMQTRNRKEKEADCLNLRTKDITIDRNFFGLRVSGSFSGSV